MAEKSKLENNGKKADRKTGASASTVHDSEKSTVTKANGGTRSSPPRVGGTGLGEAQGEKARSASAARNSAAQKDAKKQKAATPKASTSVGRTAAKRDAR